MAFVARPPRRQPAAPNRPRPGLATAALGSSGSIKNPAKPGITPYKPKPSRPGVGPAPAAPAKPKAPATAAAVGQHAQPDAAYNSTVAGIDKAQESQSAQLQSQANNVKFQFGIDDPTNPFSRAEGLKKSYLSKLAGTSASLASQGQLYSGTHERAMARVRSQDEQARAELRQAYNQSLGSIANSQQNLSNMSEEQKNAAFEAWLQRAPEADAALPADGGDSAPSGPSGVQAPGAPQASAPGNQRSFLPVYAGTKPTYGGGAPKKGVPRATVKPTPVKIASGHKVIPKKRK